MAGTLPAAITSKNIARVLQLPTVDAGEVWEAIESKIRTIKAGETSLTKEQKPLVLRGWNDLLHAVGEYIAQEEEKAMSRQAY